MPIQADRDPAEDTERIMHDGPQRVVSDHLDGILPAGGPNVGVDPDA
jgi:hypothetical protein